MKKTVLFLFVVLFAFAFVFNGPVVSSAFALEKGVIKFAHSQQETDLFETHYKALTGVFGNLVEQGTQGRFTVESYPNGQLGDLRSMLEQCQRGMIQVTAAQSIGLLASYYPAAQVFEIPYALKNPEIVKMVFNSSFGKDMVKDIAEKTGLRILALLPSGMRSFTNNVKEIRTPDDMKGLKIRVMQIPIHLKMVEALGASATPIAWEELYTSLQTGVADGQENAPNTMLMAKLEEVQKFYTLDQHTANNVIFAINEKFFQSLSPRDQKVIEYAARQASEAFLGIVTAKESRDLEYLATKLKITPLSPEEIGLFKEKAQPPVVEYLKGEIDPKVVDAFLKAVEEAEAVQGL